MDSLRTARVVSGPLAPFEAGFRAELQRTGYTPSSQRTVVAAMAQLSAWMRRAGLQPAGLSPTVLEAMPARLRGTGPVVRFLRELGVVPAASCVEGAGPLEVLQAQFAGWLTGERGLARETVRCYVGQSRAFLLGLGEPLDEALAALDAATVTTFMVEYLRQLDGATAKASVTAIRALLRFLHVAGHVPVGLAGAVPAMAGWRQASLPRGLQPGEADRLLAGCDRTTPAGRRDYAVLMMLAQLGLRGGEVAALQMDDIDWHAGEITIRGKAARIDRLPLPVATGEALADYVTRGRPRCEAVAVFITLRAPHRGLTPAGVRGLVARCCARAGLPRLGAHRLRHALACDLLQAGGSLAEVGQILRHRSALATSTYAKVDLAALAGLVRPWPGGCR